MLYVNLPSSPFYLVALSTIFWGSLLYMVPLVFTFIQVRSFKFRNLVIAMIHDSIIIILSFVTILHGPNELGGKNTCLQSMVNSFSFGYFIADIVCYIYHGYYVGKMDQKQLFHHTCCILGFSSSMYSGRAAFDLDMGLLLTNLSSPPGYMRFMLKEIGMQDTDLCRRLKSVYITIKFISICLLSPPVVFSMVINQNTPIIIRTTGVGILGVNIDWLLTSIYHF